MKYLTAFGLVAVLLLVVIGTKACRDAEIENCRERGGQAITAPWYSDKYGEVRCIEASK